MEGVSGSPSQMPSEVCGGEEAVHFYHMGELLRDDGGG